MYHQPEFRSNFPVRSEHKLCRPISHDFNGTRPGFRSFDGLDVAAGKAFVLKLL